MWKKIVKAVVLFVSLVALALWAEQATREVRESVQSIPLHYLWWGLGIAVALALLVWFLKDAERRRQTAGVYRSRWFLWPVVLLLLVGTGIGTYEYGHLLPITATPPVVSSSLDTIFTVVARPGQPAEAVMPPGWWLEWKEDDAKFSSYAIWRGEDKVRVFITKPYVESAEIEIRKFYDPARRR